MGNRINSPKLKKRNQLKLERKSKKVNKLKGSAMLHREEVKELTLVVTVREWETLISAASLSKQTLPTFMRIAGLERSASILSTQPVSNEKRTGFIPDSLVVRKTENVAEAVTVDGTQQEKSNA